MALSKIREYEFDKSKQHDSSNGIWYEAFSEDKKYFFKQFKEPKYPSENMMSDPKCAEYCKGKKALCEEWFSMRKRVIDALRKKGNGSGNIVCAKQFFREKTSYYGVTEWIDIKNPSLDQIASFKEEDKLFLLLTFASALKKVHDVGVIHGDLKPDNVLVTESDNHRRVAKIIDFDDSYFSKEALPPDITKSTPPYKSPELAAYIVGKSELRDRLTCASDVFASGLLFHEFWCGKKPKYGDNQGKFFYQAVIAGEPYELDPSLPSWLHDMIADMLQREPECRPTMEEIHQAMIKKQYVRKQLKNGYKRASGNSTKEVYFSENTTTTTDTKPSIDLSRLKEAWNKVPADLETYEPKTSVDKIKLIISYIKINFNQLTQVQVDELAKRLVALINEIKKRRPVSAPPSFNGGTKGKLVPAFPLPRGCRKVDVVSDNLVKVYMEDGRTLFKTAEKAIEGGFAVLG